MTDLHSHVTPHDDGVLVNAPFVILFQGRSGSTHLTSLLNSHPEVSCCREVLDFDWERQEQYTGLPARKLTIDRANRIYDPDPEQVIHHLDTIYKDRSLTSAGFKFKFPVQVEGYPEAHHYLLGMGNRLRVIVLDRRNVLKRAISKCVLTHFFENSLQLRSANLVQHQTFVPISVDVSVVTEMAREFAEDRNRLLTCAAAFPNRCLIEYEDLLHDQLGTMTSLLTYLEVPTDSPLASEFKKATPDQLSSAIANYDELQQALTGTPFEEFLD